jgi:hypothetical protein
MVDFENRSHCPTKGVEIIPDEAMLREQHPVSINCPACDGIHIWDPLRRTLTKTVERQGPQQCP